MTGAGKAWQARLDRRDLEEGQAPDAPWPLFEKWYGEAEAAGLIDASAMTLATADPLGKPSARTVLLKGYDQSGFVFYSNYESRKARELMANPRAALVFWWDALERQVRVEGTVAFVSAADSDAYFASRGRDSQLGAHASPQSRVIASRGDLEAAFANAGEQFGERVPRPPHWGGYRVAPVTIEFWQGRANRLHDRLRYRYSQARWRRERLAP